MGDAPRLTDERLAELWRNYTIATYAEVAYMVGELIERRAQHSEGAQAKVVEREMTRADLGLVSEQWIEDSLRWRGKILTGWHAHWCPDWDYLPIDETTPEWPCPCAVVSPPRQTEEKTHE